MIKTVNYSHGRQINEKECPKEHSRELNPKPKFSVTTATEVCLPTIIGLTILDFFELCLLHQVSVVYNYSHASEVQQRSNGFFKLQLEGNFVNSQGLQLTGQSNSLVKPFQQLPNVHRNSSSQANQNKVETAVKIKICQIVSLLLSRLAHSMEHRGFLNAFQVSLNRRYLIARKHAERSINTDRKKQLLFLLKVS